MKILDTVTPYATCWADTMPKEFDVAFEKVKSEAIVAFWGAFDDENGGRHACTLGDTGLICTQLQEDPERYLVRCNTGISTKKDFSMLHYEVERIH